MSSSGFLFIFMLLFEIVSTIENHNQTNSTVNQEIILPRALKGNIRFGEDNFIQKYTKNEKNKIKFDDTDTANEIGYSLFDNKRDESRPIKFENTVIKDTETINQNFDNNLPIKVNENQQTLNSNELQLNIKFEEEITNPSNPSQKKKRRKRRKPRLQNLAPGYYPEQINGQNPYPAMPGYQENYGFYQGYGYPGGLQQNLGQLQRPGLPGGRPYRGYPQRPDDALSSITEALTSIARYDDLQCVPRLLCEVAGGRAPAQNQGSGLLQTMVNLQPLVTLLAAYNGVSTSPLFVFGRAVILGMSSRGSSSACSSSYPLCPNDPEKLVEYLNNHNGGFFRFFNNPQLGQNPNGFNQNFGDNAYGLYQNGYGYYTPQDNYGVNNIGLQIPNQNYGFNNFEHQIPNQNYGFNYPQYGSAKVNNEIEVKNAKSEVKDAIENKIEDRIVNINEDHVINWAFPNDDFEDNKRLGKGFSFEVNTRLGKGFRFPEKSSVFTSKYGLYFPENVNKDQPSLADDGASKIRDDDEEIVYIVRGDGDPNNPEIVKVKKGETVS